MRSIYRPQLATPAETAPEGDDWLHEIALEGCRIGCLIDGARVRLLGGDGRDRTGDFLDIADEARRLPGEGTVLDGIVATLLPDGRTRCPSPDSSPVYFLFDLLRRDAEDLSDIPLEERKSALYGLVHPLAHRAGFAIRST